MPHKPLVSVIMTAYNEEDWVEMSIKSLLNQSYENLEIIFVDDNSNDATLDKVNELKNADNKIKIIKRKNNSRVEALNDGLAACDGKFIAINDADVVSREDRVSEQVKFLQNNSSYSFVGSWRKHKYEDGKIVEKPLPVEYEDIKDWLIRACVLSHSATMYRADVIKKYKYSKWYRGSHDYEMWVRMIRDGHKVKNLPKYLTTGYIRSNSITRSKDRFFTMKEKLDIKRKCFSTIDYPFYKAIWLLKPVIELVIPR